MNKAAEDLRFEEAAMLRDEIAELRTLLARDPVDGSPVLVQDPVEGSLVPVGDAADVDAGIGS